MKDLEVIAKEFLRPAADLVNGSIIFKDIEHGATIAHPKEFGAPQEFVVLADAPTAAGGFADKGVKVPLPVGALPRTKANWLETGTTHGDVKVAYAGSAKGVKGADGGQGVVGLHEDPSHAEG